MECPGCQAQIDDAAVVCPHCEAVVDPSLLNAAPPEQDGDDTGRQEPLKPKSQPKVRRVVKRADGSAAKATGAKSAPKRAGTARMPEAPPAGEKPKRDDWRQSVAAEDWGPDRGAPVAAPRQKTLDADDYLGHIKQFVTGLTLADKIGFFGALATLVACFLPWKDSVTEGDVLGVGSAGFLVALTSLAGMMGVIMRSQQSVKVNAMLLWVLQLGSAGFGMLWCFICIRLAWDSTQVHAAIGNEMVWASKPAFGVYIAILTGAATIVGTVLGLKESQPR